MSDLDPNASPPRDPAPASPPADPRQPAPATAAATAPALSPEEAKARGDRVLGKVKEQMGYYDKKADDAKRGYRGLKVIELLAAASIPVVALLPGEGNKWIVAVLGALITVLEGFQQLFRSRDNWLNYRGTAESIRRELFLFEHGGSPYAPADGGDPVRTLTERIAALTSQENTKWIAYAAQPVEAKPPAKPDA